MAEKYRIAVVGSGPGGLSAAAHAAELGVSHVLLEKTALHADTIQKYQKGKHVMAEPNVLPLRSPVPFEQGTREAILDGWGASLREHSVNVRYRAGVAAIEGQKGDFRLTLDDGEVVEAEHVVLGIGVQGNPRRLGVDGQDAPFVQYQLDDPDEYRGETIVVVGAGDAAIENAVALSRNNDVYIVNRRDEFARAKDGNVALITAAIDAGDVKCLYGTNPAKVEIGDFDGKPGRFTLSTPTGEAVIAVDRIIARLGAVPQRKLVESFGVEFPNADANALPVLSTQYESNVPGMYIIGALGGYPLIKQAMNQGYETVEYILGNRIQPADHPLLEKKFEALPYGLEVDEVLSLMQERIPIFAGVNPLTFREVMLDSEVHVLENGAEVFRKNDYTNSFYTILDGHVEIEVGPEVRIRSGQGNFFGEISLLSGRRRSCTVYSGSVCVLVETPRKTMNKLRSSVDAVQRVLDETFILRTIQQRFAPNVSIEELRPIAQAARINQYKPGEVIFTEGTEADALHLIRSGSVTIAKSFDGREIPMNYLAAGNYVGEMGLLGNSTRSATVRATVKTETISLDSGTFLDLVSKSPELLESMQDEVKQRTQQNVRLQSDAASGDMLSFLMQQGLGEATDVLLIDKELCVGCDNCEVACAETHDGTSRLNRKAGAVFAHVHVPTSCRHCEDPHCMKECPPDAIKRAPGGEVFIQDNCIGCGNCERNCPYGVIQMAYTPPKKPGIWSWLLFGAGPGPGQAHDAKGTARSADDQKKAVKCDMCKDQKGGPACVRACPTGAALRLSPEEFVEMVSARTA
ncbi:MAG: cyclic nucleotide-binding domain-containing protein [Pseudomonadales bacterium]|jgi:CRP-like cAMP-binding protein/thioredoxin reductase|nr:cyclic nucleotide-binding domain-containing protein [Pseudomonadales bacterium]